MNPTMDYLVSEKLRLESLYIRTKDNNVKRELDDINRIINIKLKEINR